ncbi:TetR/AcrR family transcriptional regulator [Janibacter indicus]|uniref:TetR/AcrR family transcriptional regulator n=1 Tax=Janibacter indicus TaxID=857417 RepID=UPI003EBDD094
MSRARQALLDRAIDYYVTHGVRDTSLRTLAANIGTSQRMLNYHFGSREDVLNAVIEAIVKADTATVQAIFEKHSDPFEAGREAWELVRSQGQGVGALFFELSSHAMRELPHTGQLAQVLTHHSEAAFAAAFLKVVDDAERSRRLARLTVAVGRGLLFEALLDRDFAASDAALDAFLGLLTAEVTR